MVRNCGNAHARAAGHAANSRVLACAALKKLCNHPKLIYDMIASSTEKAADGFTGCEEFFPPVRAPPLLLCCGLISDADMAAAAVLPQGVFDDGRTGRGLPAPGWEMLGCVRGAFGCEHRASAR